MKRRAPSSVVSEAVVVKLGGSLGASGSLERWLAILVRARRPVVIVPGGGAFANAVRQAQVSHRFNDATAHRMAILAMEQTGLMLIALQPRLVAARSAAEIRTALEAGRIPVWMPLAMADRDHAIPQDWSITSDGLAARLAEKLNSLAVCLVKSCGCALSASPAQLVRDGLVDPVFADIVERSRLRWRVFGPGDERSLARALAPPPAVRLARKAPAHGRRRGEPNRRRTRAVLSRVPPVTE